MSDNIKVAIRVRPLILREREQQTDILWDVDDEGHTIKTKDSSSKPYAFDRVFKQSENTDYVYAAIAAPIVEGAMEGFHGTIFAYGQTSSGKTFTMMGTEDEPGIIKQAVAEIFNTIENTPSREFLIRASYMEIYNENVSDLLSDKTKKSLDIREDTSGQVYVPDLKEEIIQNVNQIFNIMKIGDANRHVGATNMNEKSSRSHSIFRVIIESKERDIGEIPSSSDGAVNVSHLNLVDLAGSEKARNTGASGQRLVEGGYINKSLFTLGKIISQLSDGASFVNYRDSKLTRILQNSLGGNSKTAIICNVTPASLEETHSTLRFATSAKKIQNKAIVNEVVSDEAMLKRYKKQITVLTRELEATKKLEAVAVAEENQELKQTLSQQQNKIERLTTLICVSSKIHDDKTEDKFRQQKKRRETWCPGKGRSYGALHPKPDIQSHIDLATPFAFPRREPNPKFLANRIATRASAPVELIEEEEMPLMDTSIPMDTSLVSLTQSLHKEFDVEVNYKKRVEEMESELMDMQKKVQESVEISTGLAQQNDNLKACEEMAESQFKILNAKIRSLETELELKTEDLYKKEQLLSAKDKEMCELQDFIDTEKMMKEDSFMAKQFGEDMVDDLRARICDLERTQREAEECLIETRRQLAMVTDDKMLLEQQITELQNENEHLDSDKQDFDTLMEMEKNKHRQRERELLEQLEQAYSEARGDRSATPTPADTASERCATPTPDGVRCGELEQQVADLKEELQQNEHMQEQLIMKLQDAEAKIEQLQSVRTKRHGSDPLSESQVIDDSMTLEMRQFGMASQPTVPATQDAPLHWEMEEARLKAEKEELTETVEELKKQLLSIQLENTEMQEKMTKLHDTTRAYSGDTVDDVSTADNELLQKVDMLSKQLEAAEELKSQLEEDLKDSVQASVEAQEDLLNTMNKLSSAETELQHARTKLAELEAESIEEKPNSPVKSPGKDLQSQQLTTELTEARDKITQLEFELDQALEEVAVLKHSCEAQESHDQRLNELKEQLDSVIGVKAQSEEKVIELEDQLSDLQNQLKKGKEMYENLQSQLNEKVEVVQELESKLNSSTSRGDSRLEEQLAEERKAFLELEKKYGQLLVEQKHKSDRLLSETNRDIGSQRRIQELEVKRRESIAQFQQASKESQQLIDARDKQIYELKTQLQKAQGECELAQHNEKKAQEQIGTLKQEIRDLEDLHTRHEANRGRQELDPEKMADKIKKLAMSADLSQQRASKYEAKIKELEAEAKRTEDAVFQKNNLQRELREMEHSLHQKQEELSTLQKRFSTSHADIMELKMEIDTLKEKLERACVERDNATAAKDMMLEEKNSTVQQKEKLLSELQQVSSQAADYKKQLSKHGEDHDSLMQRLCNEKDKLQEEYNKLQATIKQLQSEGENLLQQVEQAKTEAEEAKKCLLGQEEEMDSIQGHLNSQITEMQNSHKQAVTDLENKHQIYVSELEASHKTQREDLESQLRQEICNLTDHHNAAINDVKTKHSQQLEAAEAKIKDLKEELISHISKGADIDMETIQEKHQGELLAVETQLRDEMDELLAKYESEAAVKQALHDQAMSDIESKHAETVNTLKSDYEQKLIDLEGEQIRQQEELEKRHQRELDDCITGSKEEIALARNEQEAEMKQLQEKHDNEMQELMEHLASQSEEHKQEKMAWITKLEDELASTSAQYSEQMKAQECSYKQQIETLEAKYTEVLTSKACESNKETEERIQDLVKHYEDEKAHLEEKYEEIIKVKTEDFLKLHEKLDRAEQELSENRVDREGLHQQITEIGDEVEKKSTTISSLTEQITELNDRLEEKSKIVEQLQEHLEQLETKHANDKLELETNLKEEYSRKLSEAEVTAQSDTMGQMELAQSEAADLKECLEMALQEKEELEHKVMALETRLERKEAECIQLAAQEPLGSKDMAILEKRIFTLESDIKYLREEKEKVENICDELDEENAQYQEEIKRLKQNTDGVSDAGSTKEIQRLKGELKKRTAEIETLKKQKANVGATSSSQDVEKLKKIIENEKDNAERYKKEKDRLEDINDTLEEENENYITEIKDLKTKLEKLGKRSSVSPSVDKLTAELTKTKKDLAESKLKNAQLTNELILVADPLKKKIKEISKENEYLSGRCQNLKGEVRRLKNNQPDDSVISQERPNKNSDEGGTASSLAMFKLECDIAALARENKELKAKLDQEERALSTKKLIESELRSQLAESDRKYRRVKAYCTKHKMEVGNKALTELLNSPKKDDRPERGAVGGRENQSAASGIFSSSNAQGEEIGDCKQQ